MILQRVSPVTHSIGNCLKRVIVIIASVIVFQNPMSRQNMIGASKQRWRLPMQREHLKSSTGHLCSFLQESCPPECLSDRCSQLKL